MSDLCRRVKILSVGYDRLMAFLQGLIDPAGLPKGSRIRDIHISLQRDALDLSICSEEFEPVGECESIPVLECQWLSKDQRIPREHAEVYAAQLLATAEVIKNCSCGGDASGVPHSSWCPKAREV